MKVTFACRIALDAPLVIDGRTALEDGSDVVWFTFPGAWHDIGLFHTADGTPTGLYANILTPPIFLPDHVWRTTDLFLDLWEPCVGGLLVLDRDEFEHAVRQAWIDEATGRSALAEVERLLVEHARGHWPPAVVAAWPRARALRSLAAG